MAKSPNQKLVCAQCGYENEPERVYCHNCGTKLDRSILPRETTTQQESLAETRRRIRKMTNPGQVRAQVKTFLNVLIWAALVASIYLLMMPPLDMPTKEQESNANIISSNIDAAIAAPQSVTVQATPADLSNHVRRVKGVNVIPFAKYKRAFATLREGKVVFGVEEDFFGYPLFSSIEYRPTVEDGTFKAEKTGFYLGRLGIHPAITQLDSVFKKYWTALKQEGTLLDKAKSITITKDRAVLVTKP